MRFIPGRFCWIAVLLSLSHSSFTHSIVLNFVTHEIVIFKFWDTWSILLENLRSCRLTEQFSLHPTRTVMNMTSTFTLSPTSHKIVFWISCALILSSFSFDFFLLQFKTWLFILWCVFKWFRFPYFIIIFFMNIIFKLKEDILIKCLQS